MTIVDTGGKASISDSSLVFSSITGTGDPAIWGTWTQAARSSGIAIFGRILHSGVADRSYLALDTAFDSTPDGVVFYRRADDLRVLDGGTELVVDGAFFTVDQYYKMVGVVRPVGGFYIVDGKLMWVGNEGSENLDTAMWTTVTAIAGKASEIAVLPLADYNSAWGGDWTEVTDTKTNPATGTTFSCAADCHVVWTFTPETGKTSYVNLRFTDASNTVELLVTPEQNLRLRNEVGGSVDQVFSGGSISDGVEYTVDLILEGSAYSLFLDNVLADSGTFSNSGNNLVTGGKVTHNLATNDIVLTTHPYPALGIATSRVICPQTTNTFTHEADFIAEIKNVTLPAADDLSFQFRISGSDELTLNINDDGSLAFLDNATSRITAAGATVSDDDDIVLVCDGAMDKSLSMVRALERLPQLNTLPGQAESASTQPPECVTTSRYFRET